MRGTMFTVIKRNVGALSLVAILAAGTPPAAWAESAKRDDIKTLQQKLDQSIQMIQALAARVKELEAKQAAPTAAVVPAPAVQVPPADSEAQRLQVVEQ